jgi:hypothetical protein
MNELPPEDHDQPAWILSLRAIRVEMEALNDALEKCTAFASRKDLLKGAKDHAIKIDPHAPDRPVLGEDGLEYGPAGEE